MPKKYQNKYRIESTRLKGWDYGSNAAYFVTMNTQDRVHHFGKILNDQMHLSPIGAFAHAFWQEIPAHFPDTELGAFVIMPDHVHGIVIIARPEILSPSPGVKTLHAR